MTKNYYYAGDAIRAYQRDTGGHFFDADTLRFFGCKVLEHVELADGSVLFIMRQLRNGFESTTDKIYRVARYAPGTDHRCGCCGQRDERGDIGYLADSPDYATDDGTSNYDFETLRAARRYVLDYAKARA